MQFHSWIFFRNNLMANSKEVIKEKKKNLPDQSKKDIHWQGQNDKAKCLTEVQLSKWYLRKLLRRHPQNLYNRNFEHKIAVVDTFEHQRIIDKWDRIFLNCALKLKEILCHHLFQHCTLYQKTDSAHIWTAVNEILGKWLNPFSIPTSSTNDLIT